MSKTLRTIAVIAGSVALIATGVGAAAGSAGIAGVASASTISSIATYASLAAGVASIGAQLTAPKPIARGSPAQVTIDIEPPRPYIVGRVMVGGVIRHDVAYGPTVAKVPNPYRWQVRVLSGVGPIQGIAGEYFDFQLLSSSGFYAGFFATQQNLGQRPQTTALVPTYGAAPGWTSASKLSGCAHVGLNFYFDKDGKRYASGLPIYTALCEGEKVYDPRQDSTFPGGSGPCRAGVESTYVYSANPACHAVTYALGRFQNGIRIFGLGQPVDTIDMPAIVDWANDCDANSWTVNMVLTEGGTGANLREQRVRNLDDLCAAGGARWYQAGGLLSFDWHRPRLSLATLTDDDILEAGGGTDAVQTVRNRMNGVRPQYISPDHNWQQITAAEIVGTTYRTEDGEKLTQVYPLNGVTNATQAGQLASYAMADSRELGPMDLQASAKWRFYRPGDTITIDSSLVAYSGQAVINQRSLNPQSLAVSLSLKSETPGKHAFALGKVASPPPTPTLAQTPEERDLLASAALAPRAADVAEVTAPANANRVPFSRFEGGRGWAGSSFLIVAGGRYYICLEPSFSGSGQDAFFFNTSTIPVTPGQRLSIATNIQAFALSGGAAPSFWQIYVDYLNAAGGGVGTSGVASGTSSVNETTRYAAFSTVPAGAAAVRLVLQYKSSAAGPVRMAFLEPMIASAAAGQTVHPDYVPGPNAVDGALPNSEITIGADGKISGIGTANITVDNRQVALGANALVNSDFTRGKFGFNYNEADSEWGVNLPGTPNYFGQRNVLWARKAGVVPGTVWRDVSADAIWNGAGFAKAPQFAMPLVQGDRVFARCLAAAHRCTFQLYILMFDSTGTLVSAPVTTGGRNGGAANGDPANFDLVTVIADAPANARYAVPMFRLLGNGGTDPYIFFTEPMIGKIPAGQLTIPAYSPGRTDPTADQTATAQRSIEPQFPTIEIRQGEAGSTGTRAVVHTAKRGTANLGGGTWSLPAQSLGAGTATINASTGTVSLSGIVQSGSYTIRYTHSDGIPTDFAVPVSYIPSTTAGASSDGPVGLNNITDGTWTVITARNLQVTLPGGSTSATVAASSVDLVIEAFGPAGTFGIEFRIMRESSPGTWSQVGSVATSSPSPTATYLYTDLATGEDVYSVDYGLISISRTATGLSGGSTQKFRLEARISSGPSRTIFISGTASATS